MESRIYNTGSNPTWKTVAKPPPSNTTTGRRVTRRPESELRPLAKPVTVSKKPRVIKPSSTAKRQAIPPATRGQHRVSSTAKKSVTFAFDSTTETDVAIAGTFNEWQPQPMKKGPDGRWSITLQLVPGVYQYRFLLASGWRDDPNNPGKTTDQSKQTNSVCEVL